MMFKGLQPYMVSISEYAQIIADEELLSFVYPSRFVNVKLFNRKEVDYERFKNCQNLAGLSQSPFEK